MSSSARPTHGRKRNATRPSVAVDSFERDMEEALHVIHENIRKMEEDKQRLRGKRRDNGVTQEKHQESKPRSKTMPAEKTVFTALKTTESSSSAESKVRAQSFTPSIIADGHTTLKNVGSVATDPPAKRPISRREHYQMLLRAALDKN